ncbi:MAG: polysaccharide deacetylase, partial [Allomuricauda sp.]
MQKGKLIISLDFELFWGVRDKRTLSSYGEALRNVHSIVPKTIEMFDEHNVKATFATVGFLFAESKKELYEYIPNTKPQYFDKNLSPYGDALSIVKNHSDEDSYHYAPSLIDTILKGENHEVGTHTFSHYYCLEPGQDVEAFEMDLKAATK